jgi:hypothetical protein
VAHFDAFVPALIRSRLTQGPDPVWQPSAETVSAALLFADLSGFSPLMSGAARIVRMIRRSLNGFGPLSMVHARRPDRQLSGDAVLAGLAHDGDQDVGLRMAAHCGLARRKFRRPVSATPQV